MDKNAKKKKSKDGMGEMFADLVKALNPGTVECSKCGALFSPIYKACPCCGRKVNADEQKDN